MLAAFRRRSVQVRPAPPEASAEPRPDPLSQSMFSSYAHTSSGLAMSENAKFFIQAQGYQQLVTLGGILSKRQEMVAVGGAAWQEMTAVGGAPAPPAPRTRSFVIESDRELEEGEEKAATYMRTPRTQSCNGVTITISEPERGDADRPLFWRVADIQDPDTEASARVSFTLKEVEGAGRFGADYIVECPVGKPLKVDIEPAELWNPQTHFAHKYQVAGVGFAWQAGAGVSTVKEEAMTTMHMFKEDPVSVLILYVLSVLFHPGVAHGMISVFSGAAASFDEALAPEQGVARDTAAMFRRQAALAVLDRP